jgi:hypothetical protein
MTRKWCCLIVILSGLPVAAHAFGEKTIRGTAAFGAGYEYLTEIDNNKQNMPSTLHSIVASVILDWYFAGNFGIYYHVGILFPLKMNIETPYPDLAGIGDKHADIIHLSGAIGPVFKVDTDLGHLFFGLGFNWMELWSLGDSAQAHWSKMEHLLGLSFQTGHNFYLTDKIFLSCGVLAAWNFAAYSSSTLSKQDVYVIDHSDDDGGGRWLKNHTAISVRPFITMGFIKMND